MRVAICVFEDVLGLLLGLEVATVVIAISRDRRNIISSSLSVPEPISIMKLSNQGEYEHHKVRYSLRILEANGIIESSDQGAITTDRTEECVNDFDDRLTILIHRLDAMKIGDQTESNHQRIGRAKPSSLGWRPHTTIVSSGPTTTFATSQTSWQPSIRTTKSVGVVSCQSTLSLAVTWYHRAYVSISRTSCR